MKIIETPQTGYARKLIDEGFVPIQLTEEDIGREIAIIRDNSLVRGIFLGYQPESWDRFITIRDLEGNNTNINIAAFLIPMYLHGRVTGYVMTHPPAAIFFWDDIRPKLEKLVGPPLLEPNENYPLQPIGAHDPRRLPSEIIANINSFLGGRKSRTRKMKGRKHKKSRKSRRLRKLRRYRKSIKH